MDTQTKTRLRNLLVVYRDDVCAESQDNAEETYNMSKCEVCDMSMSDGSCKLEEVIAKLDFETPWGLF